MKIARVTATPLHVPLHISLPGIERKSSLEACFVEVETDAGIVGHGLAAITRETVIAEIVNGVIAPAIKGDDPLANEAICEKLYWTLTPRGQTGFGSTGARGRRHRALGHQGQGARAAGVAAARRRPGARAAVRDLRLQLPGSRAACRRREAVGVAGLPAAEDGRRPRGVAPARGTAADGGHPGGRGAGAGGARGGRAGGRALHRRQLQPRSLSRHASWPRW